MEKYNSHCFFLYYLIFFQNLGRELTNDENTLNKYFIKKIGMY